MTQIVWADTSRLITSRLIPSRAVDRARHPAATAMATSTVAARIIDPTSWATLTDDARSRRCDADAPVRLPLEVLPIRISFRAAAPSRRLGLDASVRSARQRA